MDSCINKWKRILRLPTETKRDDEKDCDDILKQDKMFINETVPKRRGEVTDINPATGQVPYSMKEWQQRRSTKLCGMLWHSVNRATGEIGFSVNRSMEVVLQRYCSHLEEQ